AALPSSACNISCMQGGKGLILAYGLFLDYKAVSRRLQRSCRRCQGIRIRIRFRWTLWWVNQRVLTSRRFSRRHPFGRLSMARAYSSTAEQGTHNPLVPGSNPGGPNDLLQIRFIDLP